MKTRLMIILVVFVIVNVIFYVAFDGKEHSSEDEGTEYNDQISSEEVKEEVLFDKFNPPPKP